MRNPGRARCTGRKVIVAGAWAILLLVPDTGIASRQAPAGQTAAPEGLIASPHGGWPQWRGPRRDGISDEKGLLSNWPQAGPRLLWKIEGLGAGWSSPIIAGDRLYITGDVGHDLVVLAFDLDGNKKWQTRNGKAWEQSYPGARACCAYSEGRLYHLNAHGRLACLNAGSGDELWAVDILARFEATNILWGLSECLLVDGERVIVSPGGNKAQMAALDKRSGRTIWNSDPIGSDHATHSSPILFQYAGRRIIANCSSAHGYGVDADTGKTLWAVPLSNPHGANVATPVYAGGRVFYVTPYAELGRQYRLVAGRKGISADLVWKSPVNAVTGGAVLADGTLFAAGYRTSTWWFGIDWNSGRTRYELKGLTTGAAIYADGRLYCLDEQGTAAMLKPEDSALQVVGRFQLVARRVNDAWAHPVLHNGRLYLRYHDSLWCYDVKNE